MRFDGAVHAALVETFCIPDLDRTQRFVEHAPEDFEVPSGREPRYTVVTIVALPAPFDGKRGNSHPPRWIVKRNADFTGSASAPFWSGAT